MPTIAVLGAAHIHTPEFLQALADHPSARLAGIYDHDAGRARRLAERFGTAVLEDAAAACADPAVDAVMITPETDRQRELALQAVGAGKALFVEKPLGASYADARAIAAAVEESGVLFQTGYFLRGDPAHRRLRELIAGGALGELNRVRVVNTNPAARLGWLDDYAWMADRRQAGVGGWGDEGAHAIDLLRWLTRREVQRVQALLGTRVGRYGEVDEHGEVLLELDGGLLATVAAGWIDRGDVVQVEAAGTEGHAWIAGRRLWVVSEAVHGADGSRPWEDLPAPLPHAFTLFLDALAGGDDAPLVRVSDAARTTAVLQAAYESAAGGAWAEPVGG